MKIVAWGLVTFLALGPALVELDLFVDTHEDVLPDRSQYAFPAISPSAHQHGDADDHHHEGEGGCHHASHCCTQHGSGTMAIESLLSLVDGKSQHLGMMSSSLSPDPAFDSIFHPPLF